MPGRTGPIQLPPGDGLEVIAAREQSLDSIDTERVRADSSGIEARQQADSLIAQADLVRDVYVKSF